MKIFLGIHIFPKNMMIYTLLDIKFYFITDPSLGPLNYYELLSIYKTYQNKIKNCNSKKYMKLYFFRMYCI